MIYLLIGKISSDTLQLLTTQHMYVCFFWLNLAKCGQIWLFCTLEKKVACEVHNPFIDAVDNDELDLLTQSQPSLLVYSWDYFRFFEFFLNRSSQPCSYGLKVRNCLHFLFRQDET